MLFTLLKKTAVDVDADVCGERMRMVGCKMANQSAKKMLWPLLNKKLRQAAVNQYCSRLSEETSYAVKKKRLATAAKPWYFCSLIYSEHMVG